MIFFKPIWGVVLRHARLLMRDNNVKLACFYWPFLDILFWGVMGSWMQVAAGNASYQHTIMALSSVLLWQTTCRSTPIIAMTFTEELYSYNLINLFTLPLSLTQWAVAAVLYGGIVTSMIVLFCMVVINLVYKISFWFLVSTYVIFALPLFISGLWLAFSALAVTACFGKRANELVYVISWIFVLFGAVYYPVSALPVWAQAISRYVPISYVFEALRLYLTKHTLSWHLLLKAYGLSILYATVAITLFFVLFNRSKQKGLARLSD